MKKLHISLLGASAAALVFVTTTALAGSGVGDVFNLGQQNTVDAQSELVGQANGNALLRVRNTSTAGASHGVIGLAASPTNSAGVRGVAAGAASYGVWGINNTTGPGVYGTSASGPGVFGLSPYDAVRGSSSSGNGVYGTAPTGVGVRGVSNSGNGVYGGASTGVGVRGASTSGGIGVWGSGNARGVVGTLGASSCAGTYGVGGCTGTLGHPGVHGFSDNSIGVEGITGNYIGVYGTTETTSTSDFPIGVKGLSDSPYGYGVVGESHTNWAGYFIGPVLVRGDFYADSKHFRIDHPLDPAHEYLQHTSVESPDMMDIYNGNVTTDGLGLATVRMPAWFQALNRTFRYQLTIVGTRGWNARVVKPMAKNRFTIQSDRPRAEVSWQVTGIRHDRYANAHRVPVVVPKAKADVGKYLHPELYGKPRRAAVTHLRP